MEESTKIPPPVKSTDSASSVHMSYMRRDIDQININMQKGFAELNNKLDNMSNVYVTRIDFNEHLKVDEDHEKRIRTIEENTSDVKTIKKLVYGCVGLILLAFLSALTYLVIPK